MPFVLDSSVALAWVMPDEGNPDVDLLCDRLTHDAAVVPPIWPLEIGNVLLVAKRRGRMTHDDMDRLAGELRALPVELDAVSGKKRALVETLAIAERYGLTTCDAAYLEHAQRRALPLATLDSRLRGACRAHGVAVLP